MRYHVLHFTLCGGWVNTWLVDNEPQTFESFEEAQAELNDFLADIQAEIDCGDRDPDDGYSADEFCIVPIEPNDNETHVS